jgi:hypothetical protein
MGYDEENCGEMYPGMQRCGNISVHLWRKRPASMAVTFCCVKRMPGTWVLHFMGPGACWVGSVNLLSGLCLCAWLDQCLVKCLMQS